MANSTLKKSKEENLASERLDSEFNRLEDEEIPPQHKTASDKVSERVLGDTSQKDAEKNVTTKVELPVPTNPEEQDSNPERQKESVAVSGGFSFMSFENLESKREEKKIDLSKYRSNLPFAEKNSKAKASGLEEKKEEEKSLAVQATVKKELAAKASDQQ